MTIFEFGLPSLQWFGHLAVQVFIVNSSESKFIIGQRSSKSDYCPLYYCLPGGILEKDDLTGDFHKACMREVKEEILEQLEIDSMYLIAIIHNFEGTGLQLLVKAYTSNEGKMGEILGNEEWEGNKINWIAFNEFYSNKSKTNYLAELWYLKQYLCK